jgi:hypothetical protein
MLRVSLPRLAGGALVLCCALASATAQSNAIPGTDVRLGALGPTQVFTHQGTFPGGLISIAVATTSCNAGTVDVPWQAAMDPDHPFIAFLFAREANGRFEQISDKSYVKHGFFALSSSQCTPCQNPSNGTFLGVGCSDTYSTGNNGDNYWLGPPEEIDPWLGTWNPVCSHFDAGEPNVGPPNNCNGQRSLTQSQADALGPVGHRVQIQDADLNVPGASFWVAGHYVIEGEPAANRNNNLGSRALLVSWTGSTWATSASGTLLEGSIVQRWSGATVNSSTNAFDDGRLWVASKVTDLGGGQWHYEYVVHNQDNQRGVGALRIPTAPGAAISNIGFGDIDQNGANDWSAAQIGNELVFSTGNAPQDWNTLYNFWFDCDVAPLSGGQVALDQFLAGTGAPTVFVLADTPGGTVTCLAPTKYCVPKISSNLCAPDIQHAGGIASLSAPAGFTVETHELHSGVSAIDFFGTTGQANLPFQGGTLCIGSPVHRLLGKNTGGAGSCGGSVSYTLADMLAHPAGGPLLAAGTVVTVQTWARDLGDAFGSSLSDGLEFNVCP